MLIVGKIDVDLLPQPLEYTLKTHQDREILGDLKLLHLGVKILYPTITSIQILDLLDIKGNKTTPAMLDLEVKISEGRTLVDKILVDRIMEVHKITLDHQDPWKILAQATPTPDSQDPSDLVLVVVDLATHVLRVQHKM